MKKVAISGASGGLGRMLTTELLKSLSRDEIRLVTRTPDKIAGDVPSGVEIVPGDYNNPVELEAAYQGCDTLMLISASIMGHRVSQHKSAINAAKKAGVRQIVYTSYVGIHPKNPNRAACDHIQTEADLRASGLDYTILRNATYANWVNELSIQPALQSGEWMSIEGDGHFAMVDKGDVARSLAAVLADPAFHANATYEISGPDLFTFRQIAELAQEVFDRPITINEVTAEERLAFWDSMGIPRTRESHDAIHQDAEWIASDELISGEIAIAQMGFQGIVTDHVWMLTRRQPRSFRSYLEELAKTGIKQSIVQDMKEGQSG